MSDPHRTRRLPVRFGSGQAFQSLAWQIGLALGLVGLLALLLVGLNVLISAPSLAVETKFGVMIGLAIFCLVAGALGLHLTLRWRSRAKSPAPTDADRSIFRAIPDLLRGRLFVAAVLILAYLIPALAMLLPRMLQMVQSATRPTGAPSSAGELWLLLLGPAGMTAGQPWVFIWQALILAGYQLILSLSRQTAPSGAPEHREDAAPLATQGPADARPIGFSVLFTGIFCGLGLWLAAAFCYGILSGPFSGAPAPLSPLLSGLTLIIALSLAPWAEERFFRQQLLRSWPRRNRLSAGLASAALFGLVQLRPLLWLPAFLLGLGLAELVRRNELHPAGSPGAAPLASATIAHAVFNGLMYLLGWYLLV